MDILSMIELWREHAAEAEAQATRFQEGSISNTVLLTIAESYRRLANREERMLPPHAESDLRPTLGSPA